MIKPILGFKPRSTNVPKIGDENKYVAAHTTKTNPTKIGVKLNCNKIQNTSITKYLDILPLNLFYLTTRKCGSKVAS